MSDKKIEISIWKNFYHYLKPYKSGFIKSIVVVIFLGILDAAFPLLNKYAIDNFIVERNIEHIGIFILIYGIGILLLALTVYLFISTAGKIEVEMAYDLRSQAFEKLQTLSLSYYDEKAVGWLMSRLTSDINRLTETISWGIVDVFWGISLMISISISMLILNVKLALITIAVVPLLVILSSYFQRKILAAQRNIRKTNSKITAAYNEDIQGAKTTKSLNREDINLEEFSELTKSMKAQSIRSVKVSSIYIPLVLVLGSIGTALVLNVGGHQVISSVISFGSLVAFISYTQQFFEPINQMAVVFSDFQTAQASAERIFDLLNERPDIFDTDEIIEEYGDLLNPKRENWPEIKGDIEFRNTYFSYKTGETILEDFNLKVSAGETIALVGETGSGKSTIVNLICRFYEPTKGEILIDGYNYKSFPQNWIHENLGYVLQAPHLFSGSIMDNIRYGKLDASDYEVIEAAKLVNAHDFIMNTKDGYNSQVGEGGALLSTGQKQLISFARAIIRKPKIMVLDEATSSIDTESELIIQKATEKILQGRTSFVIAHRLSTIRNADKILVIKHGKVTEAGTHAQLMDLKGYYYNLYTNQFIDEKTKSV